jgi:hypothetical protein
MTSYSRVVSVKFSLCLEETSRSLAYVFLFVEARARYLPSVCVVAWQVSSDEDSAPFGRVRACAVQLQGTTILHAALLLTYCIHKEGDNRFKCDYNHRGLLL